MAFWKRKHSREDARLYEDVFVIDIDTHISGGTLTPAATLLPEGFQDWHTASTQVVEAYLSGQVTRRAALLRLQQLTFADVTGVRWAFGVSSRSWFHKRGDGDWTYGVFPEAPTVAKPPPWNLDDTQVTTETTIAEPEWETQSPPWATVGVDESELFDAVTGKDDIDTPPVQPRSMAPPTTPSPSGLPTTAATLDSPADNGSAPHHEGELGVPSLQGQPWMSDLRNLGWDTPPPSPPDGTDVRGDTDPDKGGTS